MHILVTLALTLAGTGAPGASVSPDSPDSPIGRALDRAQARLERNVNVLADHSAWENAWELETEHFSIRTNVNWYIGVRLGQNLEGMLGFFQEITGTQWEPTARQRVFLFKDLAGYKTFGDTSGGFHSSILGSFYAVEHAERPVATYVHPNPMWLGMWATHSAYHQFAATAFARPVPTWFDEGLASYFAGAYWDEAYLAAEFVRISNTTNYIPLATLLREPIDSYPADPHTRFTELGMMFNYLLHHRPETKTEKNEDGIVLIAPAADYVAGILMGKDVTDNPVHELLTVRLEELETDLRAFRLE